MIILSYIYIRLESYNLVSNKFKRGTSLTLLQHLEIIILLIFIKIIDMSSQKKSLKSLRL